MTRAEAGETFVISIDGEPKVRLEPILPTRIGSIGAMREDAELLDEIVADAMRQRQIQAWHPSPDDFAALEAIANTTGKTVQDVLNDAVRHFLDQRNSKLRNS